MSHTNKLFISLRQLNFSLLLLGTSVVTIPVQAQPFFFQDDFNRTNLGPNWDVDVCGTGTVQIVSDRLHIFSPAPGNTTCSFNRVSAFVNSPELTDVTIEFDFDGGPLIRQNNTTQVFARFTSTTSYYFAHIQRDILTDSPLRQRVAIGSSSKDIIIQSVSINLAPGRYQFSVIGNQLTFKNVAGSGTPFNLTVTDSEFTSGRAGFATNEAPEVFIDNVTIEGRTGLPHEFVFLADEEVEISRPKVPRATSTATKVSNLRRARIPHIRATSQPSTRSRSPKRIPSMATSPHPKWKTTAP